MHLKRSVGVTGVVMLGAGSAIGVSIFSVMGPAAQVAGSGLLIALAIASVPMILFGMSYSYLASALPQTGASYEWPRRFLGPFSGFAIAWLRILANIAAMAVLGVVLVRYASEVLPLPEKLTMAAVFTAIYTVNYSGTNVVTRAQTALMLLLLSMLAIVVAAAAPGIRMEAIGPLTARGWPAILAATPLLITLFLGVESGAEIGEEVHNPQRSIPIGIALSVLLVGCVYAVIATVLLASMGPERLASSAAPILDVAKDSLGMLAKPLVVTAAVVSMLKAINVTAMTFSRALFAMARTGVLPPVLSRIHPKYGTPHLSILAAYGCSMVGLLLPSSVTFLLLAISLPMMLKYLACSLSAVRMSERHPEVARRAKIPLNITLVYVIGYGGAACAVALIITGLSADWRPYALLIGWMAVGWIYYKHRRHEPLGRSQVQGSGVAALSDVPGVTDP